MCRPVSLSLSEPWQKGYPLAVLSIAKLLCYVKLDELHCGCQVAMLQADLESQKAVQKPVSSSRESEDHDVPKSKPSVYQSINFNQAIYHSVYLCIFSGIAPCAPSFFPPSHTHKFP